MPEIEHLSNQKCNRDSVDIKILTIFCFNLALEQTQGNNSGLGLEKNPSGPDLNYQAGAKFFHKQGKLIKSQQ
jgi:hypothetical protein